MAEIEKKEVAETSGKPVKAEKEKKPVAKKAKVSLKEKISKFIREYKSEIKKISWCQPNDLVKLTGIVLVSVVIVSVCVGALDFGFSKLMILIGDLY